MITETKLKCRRCLNETAVKIYDSINIHENPELKEKVMDGSIFMWECPHCGTHDLIPSQLLYHDPEQKLMIWITGKSTELENRIAAAYSSVEEMKGYTARFVNDAGSLMEKVKLFDAGLDDAVMEMCKYVTKLEVCEQNKNRADEILGLPFKFLKLDGADNELTLAYPLDGQMQMVAVGFNVYEDCRGIIQRNPSISSSLQGFCRVDAEWLSRHIR